LNYKRVGGNTHHHNSHFAGILKRPSLASLTSSLALPWSPSKEATKPAAPVNKSLAESAIGSNTPRITPESDPKFQTYEQMQTSKLKRTKRLVR